MPLSPTERLAVEVRRQRRAGRLTQNQLGELVGLDGTAITRIETFERGISLDLALRLCDVLDIDLMTTTKDS